jgi:hypothetical protein
MNGIVEYTMRVLDTRDETVARSVAISVLQYVRTHITDSMIEASRRTGLPDLYLPTDDADKFRAMLSAALNDIEGGAG